MKILFLNPNSSQKVTELLVSETEKYQTNEVSIEVCRCEDAPAAIVTSYDELVAGINVVNRLKHENYDAAIIGCFADPGLHAARSCIKKPIVGIFESSIYFAHLHGMKYSIIASGDDRDLLPWEGSIRAVGETASISSVRYIASTVDEAMDVPDEKLAIVIENCKQDGAGAVILGCASFAGKGSRLSKITGIPVLDGIEESIRLAEMLAKYRKQVQIL